MLEWYDYAIVMGGCCISTAISLILFARYVRRRPWVSRKHVNRDPEGVAMGRYDKP